MFFSVVGSIEGGIRNCGMESFWVKRETEKMEASYLSTTSLRKYQAIGSGVETSI